jgi:putative transposase
MVFRCCRIFGDLREVGEMCGLHSVERLMAENGIKPAGSVGASKKPRRLDGRPSVNVPNRLQLAYPVDARNTIWVTDTTWTWHGSGTLSFGHLVGHVGILLWS